MENKVCVVTGASKGIGSAIAVAMAGAGYDVAVNYHTDQAGAEAVCERIRALGRRAVAVRADVGETKEAQRLLKQAVESLGRIDVWVNNAGISSEAYFLDTTEEFFDRMNRVDWKGLYFCSQYAARYMIENHRKGVIINIASNQADGCWPRATVYAPVKAAVVKFTQNAAMELARQGIRMVAIAPGYTDVGWEKDDIRWEAADRLPLQRFASTEEIAQAAVYLAGENAAYITGSTLTIDGGATLPVVAANDFQEDTNGD